MSIKSLVCLFLFSSVVCFAQKGPSVDPKVKRVVRESFGKILDSLGVKGSILIYDSKLKTYYSNDFKWAKTAKLPASTFKIPNSIIALETKIIESDTTVIKWNGEKRALPVWEQDLTFKKAIQVSCVPCYQEIARKIGTKRMKEYLAKLDYPGMDVDSVNIDYFWLRGKSAISQLQQVDFLYRLYNLQLPVSAHTSSVMKTILEIEKTDTYTLSGKTGYGVDGGRVGWFVGYVQKGDTVYYFATNIAPGKDFDDKKFFEARIVATKKALRGMGVID